MSDHKCDKCGSTPEELWSSFNVKEWLCILCFKGYSSWGQYFSDIANGRD